MVHICFIDLININTSILDLANKIDEMMRGIFKESIYFSWQWLIHVR